MLRFFTICFLVFVKLNGATHSFMLENDLFTGTDDHYTNGAFYTIMEDDQAFTLAQLMFTPTDIGNSEKILDDYPYAGHIGLTWHFFQYNRNFFHNMGVSVGSVGPIAKTEIAQKKVHEFRDLTIPEGWHHQLDTQATAGVLYQIGAKTKTLKFFDMDFDWTSDLRFDYGNFYSGINVGTLIRFGNHLPKNFPTTGAFFGGQESSMLNMKSVSDFSYSISLGGYANKVGIFYVIDEAHEYDVEDVDYTTGAFASLNLYYKKFEFELQFKSVYVNVTKINPIKVTEHHGAAIFRWKWD